MSAPAFWRVAISEKIHGEVKHVGFAYHWGTRRNRQATGIEERHMAGGNRPLITRGELVYGELQDALNEWKAEHEVAKVPGAESPAQAG